MNHRHGFPMGIRTSLCFFVHDLIAIMIFVLMDIKLHPTKRKHREYTYSMRMCIAKRVHWYARHKGEMGTISKISDQANEARITECPFKFCCWTYTKHKWDWKMLMVTLQHYWMWYHHFLTIYPSPNFQVKNSDKFRNDFMELWTVKQSGKPLININSA